MTGQIHDGFHYRGRDVSIVEIRNGGWFRPSCLDMEPVAPNTACWRGYHAQFALFDSCLVLNALHINLMTKSHRGKRGRTINGVKPKYTNRNSEWFNNQYEGIEYRLDYTGSLLLGEGFIRNLYSHGGFQSKWKFERVFELVFMEGFLLQEWDRSQEMEQLRNLILDEKFQLRLKGIGRSLMDDDIPF